MALYRWKPGGVYFIRCDQAQAVRIGVSRNPKIRLAALQSGCPFPLRIQCVVRLSEHAGWYEGMVLQRLDAAGERIQGDWFRGPMTELLVVLGIQGVESDPASGLITNGGL